MGGNYRYASGQITGTAGTQPTTGASSRTTYPDASGRLAGSAYTRTGSRTRFRDASGRLRSLASTDGL